MNTTIPSAGSGYAPASAEQAQGQPANDMPGAHPLGDAGLGALHAELLQYVSQPEGPGRLGGETPRMAAPGAPTLDAPTQSFSVSELVDLLRSLRSKSQDLQFDAAKKSLEMARNKADLNTSKQLEKIKQWADKAVSAKHKGLVGKILGWVGKAVAFVTSMVVVGAALAATVATAGGAAPLLAFAIVGAASATMALVSAASTELGGPEISFGSLMRLTVGKFLTNVCGVDPKKADNISKICGGVLALTSPLMLAMEPSLVGDLAQGIALLAGANEKTAGYLNMALTIAAAVGVGIVMAVATCGTSMASSVTQVGNSVMLSSLKAFQALVSGASGVVSAGTKVAQGGFTISKVQLEEQSERAISEKKELEAWMVKWQQQMEVGRDEMKKIFEAAEDSVRMVNQMLADTTDTMRQIMQNMNSKSTV